MNDKWIAACGRIIMAGLIGLFGSLRADAEQKFIRLRNETIITEPAKPAQAGASAKTTEQAPSGLRLIQLEGPLQPGWREQLLALHVVLLQYVPDETFVARVNNTPPDELRKLPFVRWVGQFKPEHKLHSAVWQAAAKGGNEPVGVSLLLAADATPQETAGLRQLMLKVANETRLHFGTILRGQATAGQLQSLALSDKVLWIEPGPKIRLYDEVSSRIVAGPGTLANHTTMMEAGYDGRGVAVAIADTGLYTGDVNDMHPDVTGRVDAAFFYGALTDWSDEHGHGSHVSGIVAGDGATGETDDSGFLYGLGVAPGAHLVVQRIFDGAGGYEPPPTYGTLTRDAVNAGAEIGSNSWGDDTQGRYDLSAMEFDALVRDADELTPGDQAYMLEFSAGNAGPGYQTIGSPAVAKNVIATGATESDRADFLIYGDGPDVMADFSSRGPCEDGRIKPDVVAPGTWISSLRSPVGNDDNAWAPISDYYLYEGGTSQAGPHVSGAAAVVVQWYREGHTNTTPSPALVKATLINSTVDMLVDMGNAPTPNMDEGWGRVDLTQLIGATRRYDFVDQSVLLRTGQFYERRVIVGNSDEPLKLTLAYTDVPAFPGAIPALVNDLDLEVVAPDGSLYRGNQFLDGESVANAPSADNLNNVEGVLISLPDPGEYIVRVRARNVAQDARRDTTAVDQDFALVISGSIPFPGEGMVMFDRSSYTVPDRIIIKVIDSDLAGQTSTTVALSSRAQTSGFNVVLRPSASAIVFTGSVATALAPAANDGQLHLMNGDWIQVVYYDASAGATRVALGQADLVPPVISSVTVANEYGHIVVRWTTDQAANSVVRFGTNGILSLSATNGVFDTSHEVELTNVVYGQTYSFVVISTDEAGNTYTNSSSGFTFVPVRPAAVLLVDSYTDAMFAVPPLSGYTDALAQAGITNDVWDATSRGSPSLGDAGADQLPGGRRLLTAVQHGTHQPFRRNQRQLVCDQHPASARLGDGCRSVPDRRSEQRPHRWRLHGRSRLHGVRGRVEGSVRDAGGCIRYHHPHD
ncbi:MAG: S8 family serine peptidase [Verrucomicrobia bacterium]|nr:S8 family serine peptidase [Verrucomicrobiota bacterium]